MPSSSSFLSRFARSCAVLVGIVSIIAGLLVSGTLARLGLFRALGRAWPRFIGLTPAFASSPWAFTHADVAALDLSGQYALITGANSGVGFETAMALARQGARVALACRSAARCAAAAEAVAAAKGEGARVSTWDLDTSSLASVRAFAAHFLATTDAPIDMLFLNAGFASAGTLPDGSLPLSVDGIELVMATNHVGHALLFNLLLERLTAAPVSRVVLTSSASSFDSYSYGVATDLKTLNAGGEPSAIAFPLLPYGQSKLAQILFAQEATAQLAAAGVTNVYVNSFHPGMVMTGIWGKNPLIPAVAMPFVDWLQNHMMWSGRDGALTMLYLGAAKDAIVGGDIRGQYYHPQAVRVNPPQPYAQDRDLQARFWDFTKELANMGK